MTIAAQDPRGRVPEIRPAVEGRRIGRCRITAQQHRGQPPSLECGRLALRHPVGPGQPAVLSPMPEQRGLTYTTPSIEQNQLSWSWSLARQHILEKIEFGASIDKHLFLGYIDKLLYSAYVSCARDLLKAIRKRQKGS